MATTFKKSGPKYGLMTCQYKMRIKNLKGEYQEVPCGRCRACQVLNKLQWQTRLDHEFKAAETSAQQTLTYDNDHLPIKEILDEKTGEIFPDMDIKNDDVKAYLSRIRERDRRARKKHPFPTLPKLTVFGVSEHCPTSGRPHYHILFFNYHPDLKLTNQETIEKLWEKGNITTKPCIKPEYPLKDFVKQYDPSQETIKGYDKPRRFISNGVGQSYLNKWGAKHIQDNNPFMASRSGTILMPAYYLRKLWPGKTIEQIVYKTRWQKAITQALKDKDKIRLENDLKKLGYPSINFAQEKKFFDEQKRREFFKPHGIKSY